MNDSVNSTWSGESSLEKTNGSSRFPFDAAEMLTIQLCHSFLGAAGFLENIGVIIVILRHRTMLDFPSNRFVLSLAIADAVSCLATVAAVLCISMGRKFGIFCAIIQFTLLTSSGNLLILTFNRFLSVYSSLRYPALMTTERAMRLQFAPWSIAAIFSALSIWSKQEGIPHMIYVENMYYTINILMIIAFNVYMVKNARDKRINDEQHGVASPKHRLLKRKYRLFLRLLIVNLTFFGSCIPMMIVFFIYPTKESRQSTSYVRKAIWCYFAVLFNAVIHPLVYAVKLPIFVRHFNKLKEKLFSRATQVNVEAQ